MHLLEVLSLGCCLAAGAVLLGPRQPAAAAYESGQGYYEEEPDAGEAKVSPCPRCRRQLTPFRHVALSPFERTAWKSPRGRKNWQKRFSVRGSSKAREGEGKKKKKSLDFQARGTSVFTTKRKTPDRQRQPKGSAPAVVLGLPGRERSRPRPRRLQPGSDRAATRRLQPIRAPAALPAGGARVYPGLLRSGPTCGVLRRAGTGRAGERGRDGWKTLGGAAVHRNGAEREAWGDDDNETRDFPFVENSLEVIDALAELLLHNRIDGRCKVTLQSENFYSTWAYSGS